MTALAVCAVRGSDAARVVMSKVLRWLPDGGDAENRVAESWLALPASDCACSRGMDPRA
jgi:hypothetical protein